jgi:hypothetical protein
MTNLNQLSEHLQEFCQQIQAIEALYGMRITVDHDTMSLMLVDEKQTSRVIAWLGKETIEFDNDYLAVDNDALAAVIDLPKEEVVDD